MDANKQTISGSYNIQLSMHTDGGCTSRSVQIRFITGFSPPWAQDLSLLHRASPRGIEPQFMG